MMKLLFTILSLSALKASAVTYYVSNAGSDANDGLTRTTPFQTIAKSLSVSVPFDFIRLNADGIWIEQIYVPVTHLTFDSFGTGAKPLVTGFQTVTGFTQSGNVWTATASNAVNDLNCVLLNGVYSIRARTPNTGYYTFTSSQGDSVLFTNETGAPSRVGRQIAVRTAGWIIDVVNVKSQSTGTLTLSPKLTTPPAGLLTNGYFYQDSIIDIDVPNEYSYTNATKSLSVYSATTPTVQISKFDTLVKCKSYTTFQNIDFTGANKLLMQLDTNCIIKKSCSFKYGGWDALQGDGISHVVIDSCFISDCWNNGITYDFTIVDHNLTLTNNDIRRIGTAAGMGRSGNGAYIGFLGFPDSALIQYNRIDSIGYNGIHFAVYPTTIQYNYITNCSITKSDGAGIYTFAGQAGISIINNIVGNNPGGTGGITGNDIANGIYLDNNCTGVIVKYNTAFNCKWAACFVHAGLNGNIVTNNLFDDSIGIPIYNSGTPNFTAKYNILYSRNPTVAPYSTDNNTGQTTDSNYYLRPTAAFTYPTDTHAMYMPTLANANIAGTLFINPTKSDSTITFNQAKTYVDIKTGKLYAGTMILHPYETIELFESTLGMIKSIKINGIR